MSLGFRSLPLHSGGLLQAGLPFATRGDGRPHGLLLRGCVVATYVFDATDHPAAGRPNSLASAIYCDVLVYTGMPGSKFYVLPQCLVTQPRGGMHSDQLWRPRAASMDITGGKGSSAGQPGKFDINTTIPANLDGDHVLVGFLDDAINQPVILRGIPHPSADVGNTALPAGQRLRLKLADGDPSFAKHHGTYFGVSQAGDFQVDTTLANDGKLSGDGKEAPAPTDGSRGNHRYRLQQFGQRVTEWVDAGQPTSPQVVMRELAALSGILLDFMTHTPSIEVKGNDGNLVQASGAAGNAQVKVGDGAKHVALAEPLQALWGQLKVYLDTHVHGTGVGPSSPPTAPATAYNSAINSTKVSVPNG